jgi:hypothetical protein
MLDVLLYVAAIVGALCILFLGLYSLQFLFQYKIQTDSIHYKLLGLITVGRISLDCIKEVHVVQLWPFSHGPDIPQDVGMMFSVKWPSKVFTKSGILILTHRGIPRVYILSPDDPVEFANQIREKLRSHGNPDGVSRSPDRH